MSKINFYLLFLIAIACFSVSNARDVIIFNNYRYVVDVKYKTEGGEVKRKLRPGQALFVGLYDGNELEYRIAKKLQGYKKFSLGDVKSTGDLLVVLYPEGQEHKGEKEQVVSGISDLVLDNLATYAANPMKEMAFGQAFGLGKFAGGKADEIVEETKKWLLVQVPRISLKRAVRSHPMEEITKEFKGMDEAKDDLGVQVEGYSKLVEESKNVEVNKSKLDKARHSLQALIDAENALKEVFKIGKFFLKEKNSIKILYSNLEEQAKVPRKIGKIEIQARAVRDRLEMVMQLLEFGKLARAFIAGIICLEGKKEYITRYAKTEPWLVVKMLNVLRSFREELEALLAESIVVEQKAKYLQGAERMRRKEEEKKEEEERSKLEMKRIIDEQVKRKVEEEVVKKESKK